MPVGVCYKVFCDYVDDDRYWRFGAAGTLGAKKSRREIWNIAAAVSIFFAPIMFGWPGV
jgi:hypothetical protein